MSTAGIPTEVGALLQGMADARVTELVSLGESAPDVLVVSSASKVQSIKPLLDEYRTTPERRKGTSHHTALASYVAMTNRFKADNSAVFAAAGDAPTITTIFDYHPEGPERADDDDKARFCGHRAVYSCPLSDEWKAWTAKAGKSLPQADFAEFMESRILDVGAADVPGALAEEMLSKIGVKLAGPAQLMELSRGLSLAVGHTVKNAKNLSNGETQVIFEEVHTDKTGAPLQVPGAFVLAIPIFKLGDIWQVPVRLRYRVTNGQISWLFDLYRADRILERAFDGAVEAVEIETGLAVFRGTPEV